MILEIFVMLAGMAFLIKSADVVIESTLGIARALRIGEFAAGFIIIAFATSLPELGVAITASLQGLGGLVVGNVIGANISNLALVFGISIIFATVIVGKKQFVDSAQFLVFLSIIPIVLLAKGTIGFFAGLVLIALFLIYVFFLVKKKPDFGLNHHKRKNGKAFKSLLLLAVGIAVLLASAYFVTNSAASIAEQLGVSYALIGLTVVSLGTTLPELATSLSAGLKKKYDLILGNVLGSCTVNITLILGIGAAISPLAFDYTAIVTSIFFLIILMILVVFIIMLERKISKAFGFLLLAVYIAFILAELGLIPL